MFLNILNRKKAAPCKPCLPPAPADNSSIHLSSSPRCDNRLGGGACGNSNNCSSKKNHNKNNKSSLNDLQPCAPSQKPILKNRSCCQCIPNYCMCQPMPRPCNCPPPIQIDARAERECSCECPSSPECACPPSERKFPRTKIKCPNAKLCYTPRQQPGPKCHCTECQPSLPPPCDPCTSSKCHPATPRFNQESFDNYEIKNHHHHQNSWKTAGNCSSCRNKMEYDSSSAASSSSPCCGTGQSENYFNNFEEDQQVDEEIEVEVVSQCFCNSFTDNSHNCLSKNYKIQDNMNDSVIKHKKYSSESDDNNQCNDYSNFCCSVHCNNQSELFDDACTEKNLTRPRKNNFQYDDNKFQDNDRNNHFKNYDNFEKKYFDGRGSSRRSSKLIESLKRARNFFPSNKLINHSGKNCCDT